MVAWDAGSFNLADVDFLIHEKVMGEQASLFGVPNYSNDMALAMKAQARRADLGFCCFGLTGDYVYCYRARFVHESDHAVEFAVSVQDSPALAVCAAALLARGVPLSELLGPGIS